jgi:hypothetical protein
LATLSKFFPLLRKGYKGLVQETPSPMNSAR